MNVFLEFFKDTGVHSMTRLLSFTCVISAVVIALVAIINGSDLSTTAVLCGTFLGFGLGAKVTQKWAEKGELSVDKEVSDEKR